MPCQAAFTWLISIIRFAKLNKTAATYCQARGSQGPYFDALWCRLAERPLSSRPSSARRDLQTVLVDVFTCFTMTVVRFLDSALRASLEMTGACFGCNKRNAPLGMTLCHLDQAKRTERSACSYWSMLFAGFTLTIVRFLDFALRASLEMTRGQRVMTRGRRGAWSSL